MEYLSLLGLAFFLVLSPGFNTALIFLSAMRLGLRASVFVAFGIFLGSTLIVFALGFAFDSLRGSWHTVEQILRLLSVIYLLVLAWLFLGASSKSELMLQKNKSNLKLIAYAFVFQLINPTLCLSAIALHDVLGAEASRSFSDISFSTSAYVLVLLLAFIFWAFAGIGIKKLLIDAKYQNTFNYCIAGAMIIAVAANY